MTYYISMVTMNRKDVLQRAIEAILEHTDVEYKLLITDNGSTDGTQDYLRELDEKGVIKAYLLPENIGVSKARNLHWKECIGSPSVRMDDKVIIKTYRWLKIMEESARIAHCLVAVTPPELDGLWRIADINYTAEYDSWTCGACMFIPAEVNQKLGAWNEEFGLYGHEDIAYMYRASLLNWGFRYSLRVRSEMPVRAGAEGKNIVNDYTMLYEQTMREYLRAERDIEIPIS